jgi:cell division protein FtsQ
MNASAAKRPQPRPPARRVTVKQAPKPVTLRVSPARLRRWVLGVFGALGLMAAGVALLAAGLPQAAALGLATWSADAGFAVRNVRISGDRNQPRLDIYRAALDGATDNMWATDIRGIRERLVALPWIADASVSRRWPDTLEIEVVEKRPAAIWQHRGLLRLIDRAGNVLPSGELERFGQLPILVGGRAAAEADGLLALVARAPRVATALDGATLVGERRWDLRLRSGETIALPEGTAATVALAKFAKLDKKHGLIGRGHKRFDMRLPDKMVVRSDALIAAKPAGVTI